MCFLTRHPDDLHAGELAKAQLAAEHGIAVAGSEIRSIVEICCAARSCSIAVARNMLNQLHDAMPQAPKFEVLAARKMMLEAWAIMAMKGRAGEVDARLRAAHRAAEASKARDVLGELFRVPC